MHLLGSWLSDVYPPSSPWEVFLSTSLGQGQQRQLLSITSVLRETTVNWAVYYFCLPFVRMVYRPTYI
jgi:hypothetical protein